jgi:hypothetical protein
MGSGSWYPSVLPEGAGLITGGGVVLVESSMVAMILCFVRISLIASDATG